MSYARQYSIMEIKKIMTESESQKSLGPNRFGHAISKHQNITDEALQKRVDSGGLDQATAFVQDYRRPILEGNNAAKRRFRNPHSWPQYKGKDAPAARLSDQSVSACYVLNSNEGQLGLTVLESNSADVNKGVRITAQVPSSAFRDRVPSIRVADTLTSGQNIRTTPINKVTVEVRHPSSNPGRNSAVLPIYIVSVFAADTTDPCGHEVVDYRHT